MIVAYVLAGDSGDRYATMCYLSAVATRRSLPRARIVLVTDEETPARLRDHAPHLLGVVDEVRVEPAPLRGPRARSFYLKTRVRDLVAGDLVFLDADTLPVRPFAAPGGDWDVALVRDRNHHCPVRPGYPHWELPRLARMGWRAALSRYFNSGVVYYRDTAAARALSAEWQRLVRYAFARGDEWDQLALNCALEAVPVRVRELPPSYNAMVTVSPVHARGARVYHFFAGSFTTLSGSLYQHLLDHFAARREVDWAAVDRCVALDHPWMPPYWPRRLWQTGNRALAVRHFLANLPGRLTRSLRPPAAPGTASGG